MAVIGFEVASWKAGLAVGVIGTWTAAAYCFWIVKRIAPGASRVLACIPVFILYGYIPLIFSRETHLVGISTFYCIITWIASFKVLLFCYSTGPGCDPWVSESFPKFAVVMGFPAHMRREGRIVKHVPESISWITHITESETWSMLMVRSALKLIALAFLLLKVLPMRESLPQIVIYFLYSLQLYLFVTIVLETLAAIANTCYGIQIEPHFDNPFAAVSLEDFWARRWNLLVSNTLRETVYNPVLYLLRKPRSTTLHQNPQDPSPKNPSNPKTLKQRSGSAVRREGSVTRLSKVVSTNDATIKRDIERLVALTAAFLVSGLAHELAVYYITLSVTGEMTAFFTLQGVAVWLEAAWRTYFPDSMRPPRIVARLLTLGFVFVTASWLFWPPLARGSDLQVIAEMQKILSNILKPLN